MKTLVFTGLALALAALPGTAMAGRDSVVRTVAPKMMSKVGTPKMGMPKMGTPKMGMPSGPRHNWGGKRNGRWIGGWRAPGGWSGYSPVSRGYFLPSYWINPSYYIGDYGRYGLSQPGYGYGWSRYYDDAVLSDRYGRVHDSVRGVNWDDYDDYEGDVAHSDDGYGEDYEDSWGYRDERPRPRAKDRDGGLGGAAIGAAVGAATGAVVAGKRGTGAGAAIGGVLGAGAGAAIDLGDRAGRGHKLKKRKGRYHERRGRGYDDRDYGDYDRDYDDGYRRRGPHWSHRGGGYGYPGYGYGWGYGGGDTVITIQSQPVVTTTTTTTEEYVYAAAPRKRYVPKRKVWRPRPKPRCVCR